jgi:hypothetical protein
MRFDSLEESASCVSVHRSRRANQGRFRSDEYGIRKTEVCIYDPGRGLCGSGSYSNDPDSLKHFLSRLKKDNHSVLLRDAQSFAENLASDFFVDMMKNAEEKDPSNAPDSNGSLLASKDLNRMLSRTPTFFAFSPGMSPALVFPGFGAFDRRGGALVAAHAPRLIGGGKQRENDHGGDDVVDALVDIRHGATERVT